jgi:hypothetical protein
MSRSGSEREVGEKEERRSPHIILETVLVRLHQAQLQRRRKRRKKERERERKNVFE